MTESKHVALSVSLFGGLTLSRLFFLTTRPGAVLQVLNRELEVTAFDSPRRAHLEEGIQVVSSMMQQQQQQHHQHQDQSPTAVAAPLPPPPPPPAVITDDGSGSGGGMVTAHTTDMSHHHHHHMSAAHNPTIDTIVTTGVHVHDDHPMDTSADVHNYDI